MMLCFVVCFPIAAAIVGTVIRGDKMRGLFSVAATAVTLAAMVAAVLTQRGITQQIPLLQISFTLDGFRCIYGLVVCFMWFVSALLSPEYFGHHREQARYYFFFLLVLGATAGVFLSADLYTTFLFFEMMSLGSYVWVVQEETDGAIAAGRTYLTIAVLGGLVTLMGLFILYRLTGTLVIADMKAACAAVENRRALWAASLCIFFGFAAKAGLFPLHIWLPKAHPVAPAPASALLSGVLTKAGIFGALFITANLLAEETAWGNLLLTLGVITMVLGAVMAVFSNNLKYVLACSSLSQIGFIITGIAMLCLLGEENALAAHGVVLYMMNHSLVKLTLFLCAGIVYFHLHELDLNRIRGFGQGKPWLKVVFLCGACSLAGIPGFCGYLSKTLVHEAIVEYAHLTHSPVITMVEWLFLFSGGLTAAYLTKLYVAIFVQKADRVYSKSWGSPMTRIAVTMAALTLPVIGLQQRMADRISDASLAFTGGQPFAHAVAYFSLTNLKGVGISLTIGAAVYLLLIRRVLMNEKGEYLDRWPAWLDMEKSFYLPLLRCIVKASNVLARSLCDLPDAILLLLRRSVLRDIEPPGAYEEKTSPFGSLGDLVSRMTGSLSFALLLTCLGLCAVLLVVVLHAN